jgi:type I site-specific restriction-modification system R (restriction) subunit
VANQLTVIENGVNKRPDVVLFVNGLPLVVIELKNATDENASVKSAYKQLQTYKATIPSLFTYNGLMIADHATFAVAFRLGFYPSHAITGRVFHHHKATIPSLFTYNGLMIVSDGLEAKAGIFPVKNTIDSDLPLPWVCQTTPPLRSPLGWVFTPAML